MLSVEGGQHQVVGFLQMSDDHWLACDVGAPLWRTLIGLRHHFTDHTAIPAASCDDQQIVGLNAIATHLGKRHLQRGGANSRGFRQNLQQIGFAEGVAAKGC